MKTGLDYFPLDCYLDDSVKLIEARLGLEGFALVIKLWQEIYGGEGYYKLFDDDVQLLFAKSIGIDLEFLKKFLKEALARGIFNKSMYQKYKILTSKGIQERFLKCTKKRKIKEIKSEYLLIPDEENGGAEAAKEKALPAEKNEKSSVQDEENDVQNQENDVQNQKKGTQNQKNDVKNKKNSSRFKQSKVKESKVKQSKAEGEEKSASADAPPPPHECSEAVKIPRREHTAAAKNALCDRTLPLKTESCKEEDLSAGSGKKSRAPGGIKGDRPRMGASQEDSPCGSECKADKRSANSRGGAGTEDSQYSGKEKPAASQHSSKEKPAASQHSGKEKPAASQHGGKEKPAAGQYSSKEKPAASSHGSKEKPAASRRGGHHEAEAPLKRLYGEYKNVALTDGEHNSLLKELGKDTFALYIKKVDEYTEETGKRYKNAYLTIKRWYSEDKMRAAPEKMVKRTAFSNYVDTAKTDYKNLQKEILEKMLSD